ncbi:MAG: hypothetical protein AWU54_2369 [Candidatus Frackibacter sp. T328-2]|nr:MAG: hypothetical protein AWU54_2369 [Candidatus Frackibacter sp. T328-2]
MLFLPSVMIKQAKQDAWLSTILNDLFGLLTGYIIIKLGELN